MAIPPLQADSAYATALKALSDFRINKCSPLNAGGLDAAHEILPMIHAISKLLDMGHRTDRNDKSALEGANPELVAAALDGIAYLAATAMFHVSNV